MRFSVNINVMPRREISDPAGQAVERTLPGLGFGSVSRVRMGKRIEIVLEASDEQAAADLSVQMCEKMLANPVIEDFELQVLPAGPEGQV